MFLTASVVGQTWTLFSHSPIQAPMLNCFGDMLIAVSKSLAASFFTARCYLISYVLHVGVDFFAYVIEVHG